MQRAEPSFFSIIAVAALALASCRGPAGPPGPVGPAGPAGGGQAALLLTAAAGVDDASVTRFGMFERENQQDFKESTVLYALPRSGTLKNFFVAPSTVLESPGAMVTVTVRINQVDTALALTHTQAGGIANLSDTTTTVTVNQGDRISIKFEETAGVDPVVTPGLHAHYNVTLELH